MKLRNALLAALLLATFAGIVAAQQAAAPAATPSPTQKSVEAFLRNYYALGSDILITVGNPAELGTSGLMEVPIEVKTPEGSNKVKMYMTKDGRYLLQGDLNDLTKDPLAENTKLIQLSGAPVYGNPNAPITIVEYSDFQCPVCRNLHDGVRGILPKYPQVKLVFKDFPLDSVHPWARTAALAGRCAYQQNPKAFWTLYDLIYDNQDLISASNVWDKMNDYAQRAGLNNETFKACMSGPEATAQVDASIANGTQLEVHSTPTVFVNGRRLVGADPRALEQYIEYEIEQLKKKK